MKGLVLVMVLVLAGCASGPDAKGLLETLEFDENECGCFRGTATVSPGFLSGTTVTANLLKRKACPGEDTPPVC